MSFSRIKYLWKFWSLINLRIRKTSTYFCVSNLNNLKHNFEYCFEKRFLFVDFWIFNDDITLMLNLRSEYQIFLSQIHIWVNDIIHQNFINNHKINISYQKVPHIQKIRICRFVFHLKSWIRWIATLNDFKI